MGISIGADIGPYHVTALLGTGGMGDVYRAEDTRLGRPVALKVLPPRIFDRKEWLARFEREARIVSGLNHPYILTIHEIAETQLPGDFDATHYIVTELVDGITLREALGGERDLRRMLELMAQVADALRKAHSVGIVHRDLKPENIMFTRDGYAKVLDFGLAKPVASTCSADTPVCASDTPVCASEQAGVPVLQTQQGIAMGTVGYMSPEQIQGKDVDHRADVFSFGCVLYEVITGHRAFAGEDLVPMLHRITSGKAPALPKNIDSALRQLVRRCLEKNPAARYQNMGEIADGLREVATRIDPSVHARPARPQSRASILSSGRMRIIAVMPFANSSGDPELDYLSDGITESIIYALSQVRRRLRVVARNTVFAYKGKQIDPRQLAADLGATAIVTGRVQRIGPNLVVAADLVSTADGSQLWGERFQRSFSDIFAVEEQIATSISDQLKVRLTTSERKKLAQRPTLRSEAYELYLKGHFHLNRRTPESLTLAVRALEEAVAVDPNYALAWSALAELHAMRRLRAIEGQDELCALAENAARTALALDPTLAKPHATIAFLAYVHRWTFSEAERQYRAALALDPDCASAHQWYSHLLARVGRNDEALLEARLAVDIEPISLVYNLNWAGVLCVTRKYEEAEIVTRKCLELEPHNYFTHYMMSRILVAQDRLDETLATLEQVVVVCGRHLEVLGLLGHVYARLGARDEALAILREIETVSEGRASLYLAEVLVGLGELDAALEQAERLFRARGDLGLVLITPEFAALRAHPGFAGMLDRVGYAT